MHVSLLLPPSILITECSMLLLVFWYSLAFCATIEKKKYCQKNGQRSIERSCIHSHMCVCLCVRARLRTQLHVQCTCQQQHCYYYITSMYVFNLSAISRLFFLKVFIVIVRLIWNIRIEVTKTTTAAEAVSLLCIHTCKHSEKKNVQT